MPIENAKTLNTRIILKNDSLANWNSSSLILQPGEVAFAKIESSENYSTPTYLMKVGDGTNTFNNLKWVAANAADVYKWAKSKEIKTAGTGNAVTSVSVIDNDDGTTSIVLNKEITFALASDLNTFINTTLPNMLDEYITSSELTEILKDYAAKDHDHTVADITDFDSSVKAYDYATKTEAKGYADAKDAAIKAAQDAVDAIEADYLKSTDKTELQEAINGKASIGTVGQLSQTVSSIEDAVTTLIGDDNSKSVRTIANEELAAQLITADAADNLNTLQEIAAWIQDHPEDAAAMNNAITALQNQLTGINAGSGTVKKYVDDAISALTIGDYAKAADLIALAGRVTTAEGKISDIETDISDMDAAYKAADETTLASAKSYADGLAGNYAEKVHTHEITDVNGLQAALNTKTNDADLAAIAKTGSTDDLVQGNLVLVFDCGTSVE